MKKYKDMNYKERGEYQNMKPERVKAIEILEWLGYEMGLCKELEGEEWYGAEDKLVDIISSK